MKKLILAISSVFCLQLGFIAYNADDPASGNSFVKIDERGNDTYLRASVSQPFVQDQVISDIPVDNIVDQPEIVTVADDEPIDPQYSRAIHASRGSRSQRKRSELNTFVSLENPTALKPVNVTYRIHNGVEFKQYEPRSQRTEYPVIPVAERDTKNYQLSAKTDTRQKKKNLFVRVIKKPYDWLKAIGSTFK